MTTYYVATLACYVLVEANDETEAREKGHAALQTLYAELRQRSTSDEVPIEIRTVREADEDENEHWTWHQNMLRAEGER